MSGSRYPPWITGTRLGEMSAKPISTLSLSTSTLEPIKVAPELTLTLELVRAASPEASELVATELRNAIAAVTDITFFSLVLNGVSPVPSAGGDVHAARVDLSTALDALTTGANSRIFFVISSSVAKRLSMMGDSGG